jgi:prepilin-type N-terminal cleavage/methylation domain-containing protein
MWAAVRRRQERSRRDEDGLSMIEVLVAMSVFLVASAGILGTLLSAMTLTRNNRARTAAANLVAEEIDSVRATPTEEIQTGLVTRSATVGGTAYTIRRTGQWISRSASSGACDGGNGSRLAYLRISVRVLWTRMGATKPVQGDTIITPDAGAYDPESGHISVRVLDRDAQPATGHQVHVTGPGGSETQTTTDDGCAFFAYLSPGNYTVSVSTAGYVDNLGVPSPSQPVSVSVGRTTSVQFDYDRSVTLNLTFDSDPAHPVPTNLATAIGHTAFQPSGIAVRTGTGQPRVVTNLFPFRDGYEVWAGSCLDADPAAQTSTGPIWPGADRTPALAVSPGQVTAGTVDTAPMDVRVTTTAGVPVAGVQVRAQHAADNGCAAGELITIGVTDATGYLGVSLPFGRWSVVAVGRTPSTTWPTVSLAPPGSTVVAAAVTVR